MRISLSGMRTLRVFWCTPLVYGSKTHYSIWKHIALQSKPTMNAPAEIQPAIETALFRVARELIQITEALERLEALVALIASAAIAK